MKPSASSTVDLKVNFSRHTTATSPHSPQLTAAVVDTRRRRILRSLQLSSARQKHDVWTRPKRGHETKKHDLIGRQTWRVLPPNVWSLTAVKANCHAKGKLFICFWSARSAHISFFPTFTHISNLLQTSIVWRQNMSCLSPVTTCFFLTCTHLDATDSIDRFHCHATKN